MKNSSRHLVILLSTCTKYIACILVYVQLSTKNYFLKVKQKVPLKSDISSLYFEGVELFKFVKLLWLGFFYANWF